MATTNFTDLATVIVADWLNDVDAAVYETDVVVTETTTSRTAVTGEVVLVDDDTAGSTVTVTLPASVSGDKITVKKLGTTADVIIDGDAAELIDGAATFTLTAQYAALTVIADGTGWSII